MNLRLITAPAAEPVSLATAKAFLRVDDLYDDTLITSLIKSAREKGEELSRLAFITQTWELTRDTWPDGCLLLKLYRPPLQSVTSVKYFDGDNQQHTWTDYTVDTASEPGAIIFNSLPSANLRKSGAITVRFVAGYGSADTNVPERIKAAIVTLVAHWYENRESLDVPAGIKAVFMAERKVWF
jgi:uncharacterized phiE125 gp8 family phage protein